MNMYLMYGCKIRTNGYTAPGAIIPIWFQIPVMIFTQIGSFQHASNAALCKNKNMLTEANFVENKSSQMKLGPCGLVN